MNNVVHSFTVDIWDLCSTNQKAIQRSKVVHIVSLSINSILVNFNWMNKKLFKTPQYWKWDQINPIAKTKCYARANALILWNVMFAVATDNEIKYVGSRHTINSDFHCDSRLSRCPMKGVKDGIRRFCVNFDTFITLSYSMIAIDADFIPKSKQRNLMRPASTTFFPLICLFLFNKLHPFICLTNATFYGVMWMFCHESYHQVISAAV